MLYIKQLLRSPIRLISFFALLVFTGSAIGIGINAYFAIDSQIAAIENNYTTIAAPNYMYEAYAYVLGSNKYMSFEDELELMSNLNRQLHERADYVDAAIETAYNSSYVTQIELINAAGGYCVGIDPVVNYDMDLQVAGTYTSDIAILVVTCTDILDKTGQGASGLRIFC